MLIVVVIIGILAAALIPRLTSVKDRADDSARKANLQQLVTAMSSYALDNNIGSLPFTGGTDTPAISGALLAGGMKSIPNDPTNTPADIFGQTTSGYAFFIGTKWGVGSGAFAFVSRAETAGAANYVQCSAAGMSGGMAIDAMILCSTVTISNSSACVTNATSCNAQSSTWLRIVIKY